MIGRAPETQRQLWVPTAANDGIPSPGAVVGFGVLPYGPLDSAFG
jgi:hypothetical protein